jgi:hypothetical protein
MFLPIPHFRPLVLAATIVLAGCSTEPRGTVLAGQWGGSGLGVSAGAQRTEIRLACGAATIESPLQFDAMGQIDVRAVLDEFYTTYPIRFQASLVRGYLNVTLTEFLSNGDQEVEEFILVPNAKPDFGGVYCPGVKSASPH